MGLLKQAFGTPNVRAKAFDPILDAGIDLNKVVGWHSVGGSQAYGYYKDHQYENGYSSISKLANGFAAIEQYTIDKNGKSVSSNILDRLYTPNTDMSHYDFREALAVCYLVHDKVRLRVHHTGTTTRFNADSIRGFTFMEDYTETIVGGERLYRMPNGDSLNDSEVITIKSVNPDDVTNGFSPSRAARRWTRLDDYIADYQRGFFENGAVPAGQFIITARTVAEYNDMVDKLQEKHRGAGSNNNVTYSYRPVEPNTGQPLNSQIEWVPFSSQNKDMSLKDLFDNVNKKIDSVYGVPASIRGVNDQNTYASVRVDEVIFVKYALNPLTLKIWSKFTHELNRVCGGGTGVAISYDLEIPKIADEQKIIAEAKKADAETLGLLIERGYTQESVVAYIKTGLMESLILGEAPQKDEPDVLSPEEAKGTPDQPIDPYSKEISAQLGEIKGLLTAKSKAVKKKELVTEADEALAETKVRQVVKDQLTRQVNRAIAELDTVISTKAYGDPEPEQDEQFVSDMMTVVLPLIAVYGAVQTERGIELILEAGLSTEDIQRFYITEEQRAAYRRYLERVGTYFNVQTAEAIRNVLFNGIANQLSRNEIELTLRSLISEQWRIDRVATTEINRAGSRAAVMSMANIKNDTGYDIEKTMQHNGADPPCEFCQTRLGAWYPVDSSMVRVGEIVTGANGGKYVNTWEDNFGNDIHPNGHCSPIFRVRS